MCQEPWDVTCDVCTVFRKMLRGVFREIHCKMIRVVYHELFHGVIRVVRRRIFRVQVDYL